MSLEYVIRIKDNATIENNIKDTNPNKNIIEHLQKTSRIINYYETYNKTVRTRKNSEYLPLLKYTKNIK